MELCDQAKRLPEGCSSKENLRSITDGLALKNEKLKRDLEGKKDNLAKAIKAQVGLLTYLLNCRSESQT